MDSTFLSVKDLSAKLNVSEKTIYRMINDNKIPYCLKIGGQWRFNAEKIEKWAKQTAGGEEAKKVNRDTSISDVLCESTIMYKLCGENRDEVLDQLMLILNRFTENEKQHIKRSILYKESIISSSLDGISVMVCDHDIAASLDTSVFAVAYLDHLLDFKAIDSVNTGIVILIISPNKTEQLILTTRLRGLLADPEFVSELKTEPNRTRLISLFAKFESELFPGQDR